MTGSPTPSRDLVVVAGSAGGVEALKSFVAALPADLPATVLVALHLPPTGRSLLAQILGRRAALPVTAAEDGAPLHPGQVLVAQPDAHLLVVDGRLALGRGGRENGHRPSHDAMLRSAALELGPRCVGVVLTGLLDDGAAGLATVARYGGACLVQDPAGAEFPSMPQHALAAVPSARAVPLADLPTEVVRTVTESPPPPPQHVPHDQRLLDLAERDSALGRSPVTPDGDHIGEPSPYSCPDCSGVLRTVPDPDVLRFRCRTGHAWTAESLLTQQGDDLEAALWSAVRVLEERAELSTRLADAAGEGRRGWSQEHFRGRAQEATRSADAIRGVLLREVPDASRVPSGTAS